MDYALITALVAPVLAALGAYIVSTRKLSGKISTSEASDLWRESASIRADLQRTIREQREEIDSLKREVSQLRGLIRKLQEGAA